MNQHTETPQGQSKGLKIFAWVLASALVIVLIWGYWQHQQRLEATAYLENNYQRSFYGLMDSANKLSLLSGKVLAAGSPQQNSSLLWEMKSEANNALNTLAVMPVDQSTLTRTSLYFNQVGDYAASLVKSLGRGEKLTQEQYQTLGQIRQQMGQIHDLLAEMEQETSSGQIVFTRPGGGSQNVLAVAAGQTKETGASAYFSRLDQQLQKLETLDYPGAFADHMRSPQIKGLKGEEISQEQAQQKAQQLLQAAGGENQWDAAQVQSSQLGAGSAIPGFLFHFSDGAEVCTVTISQVGGQLLSLYHPRRPDSARLERQQALDKATQFLEKAGFQGMEAVGQRQQDNVLLVSYARVEDDIVYYPDAVQLSVALDNGEIISFQAKEYWTNYDTGRQLAEPAMTAEEAQGGLQQAFTVDGNRLALIADGAGGELLTHEFRGKIGEDQYLVYVNTDGGFEEQILQGFADGDDFYTK